MRLRRRRFQRNSGRIRHAGLDIKDLLEGFDQPTWRSMRVNVEGVPVWFSPNCWSGRKKSPVGVREQQGRPGVPPKQRYPCGPGAFIRRTAFSHQYQGVQLIWLRSPALPHALIR
jgi:hypothetical protein